MRPILLAVFFILSLTARAALDLSPLPSELEGEGVKYTQLAFNDDKRRVLYVPPQNWSFRGSASQLHLTPPPAFSRADATIETVPLPAPQVFDEKGIDIIRQQFASSLPPGVQAVKILSEEPSPILLNGNIPSYEITASYQMYGETFVRSLLFANLPETQLRFRLSALKKDFDLLHRQFRASFISWQWIEPAPEKSGAKTQDSPASASTQ